MLQYIRNYQSHDYSTPTVALHIQGKRCDDDYKEHKLPNPRYFYITER